MWESRADAIVVGGGTAGCVVAGRLVEAGLRVTILEAGPDYGSHDSGQWPNDLRLVSATLPAHHDWGYAGHGAGGQELAFERARVIGGCSAHNGCALSVGWAGDYDRWAAAGSPGWSSQEVGPAFQRAMERIRAHRFGRDELQPFHRAFLEAAVTLGIPETDDVGDLAGGVGCGIELMNVVDGVRWNASFAYIDPLRDRSELKVVADVVVDRVILDGHRAVGVRAFVGGDVREFRAELIVVSAGTYGSPEVLLRSGIGAADELRTVGVPAVIDLPGVGRNLHDQPAPQLEFEGTARLRDDLSSFASTHSWLPEEQAMVKLASPEADGPYDLHVYPWLESEAALEYGWRCVIPVALLTPRSRGSVRLRSADPRERAAIDHRYLAEEGDLRALVPGVRWALESARAEALTPYLGKPLRFPSDPSEDAALVEWIRSTHAHYWHPAGTCRMGPGDDPNAVVDGGGRVHGVDGLRVADASIFPDIPRATPALPTVMVGERIADAILG